jgi:hypothetical protein
LADENHNVTAASEPGSHPSWAKAGKALVREAARTSSTLFVIMIPISVATRLLQQAGLVDVLGRLLEPVMGIVGLPGALGLVWATAMVTNIYAAMVVFASLSSGLNLTVAQVTTLCTMILVAHALPLESRISQKAGVRLRFMLVLRIVGALALGWGLSVTYSAGSFLQAPNTTFWCPPATDDSWLAWGSSMGKTMGYIFVIILALLMLMKVLERVGVIRLLTRLLEPVLEALGMSASAAPVTIIGMSLGISFGGGLIIQEARSGKLTRRDVFASLALMGLCHSLIEDTLLMVVLGAHVSGILWARLAFALIVAFVLVRCVAKLSEGRFERLFCRPAAVPE